MRALVVSASLVLACTERSVAVEDGGTAEGSAGTTTLAVPTTSTSSADASSSSTGGCVPGWQVGEFTRISELEIGATERYDMDRDGVLDVVGGRGAVVLADLEVRTLASWPAANDGHPGHFDADDEPDMAHGLGPDLGFVVFRSALAAESMLVATPTTAVWSSARGDIDGNGIDDIAFAHDNAIEVWSGSADGTFQPLGVFGGAGPAWPSFVHFGGARYVVYTDAFLADFQAHRFVDGDFVAVNGFALLNGHDAETVQPFGDGDDYLLVADYSNNGFESSSSIGLLYPARDGWGAHAYDLEGAEPWEVAAGDLDGDGTLELAVLSTWIDLVCWNGAALMHCGRVEGSIPGDQLELLADPPRVLVAGDTGVWIAELTPAACR